MNINTFNFEEIEFKTTTTTTTLLPTTTTTTTQITPPSPTTTTTTTLMSGAYRASGFGDARFNGCYIGPETNPGFIIDPVFTGVFYRHNSTVTGNVNGVWILGLREVTDPPTNYEWSMVLNDLGYPSGTASGHYATATWAPNPTSNGNAWVLTTGSTSVNPGGFVTVGCS